MNWESWKGRARQIKARAAQAKAGAAGRAKKIRLPGWLSTAGQTAAVAFGMFSAVPAPQPAWNEKNMKYALCAFPLVGVVIALAFGCWGWAAAALDLPVLLRAAGFCLLPVWINGGIHLDGYADTCDALASYGGQEKRLAILKDPHCGAFAVIRLCSWFAADLGLCAALPLTTRAVGCMQLGFVLERAISGWAVAALPLAKNTGLAHTFATSADRTAVRRVLLVLAILLAVCMCAVGRIEGAAMAAAAFLVLLYYRRMSDKQFGGLSGDLAGWFLQTAELWMLAALVAVQLLEAAL